MMLSFMFNVTVLSSLNIFLFAMISAHKWRLPTVTLGLVSKNVRSTKGDYNDCKTTSDIPHPKHLSIVVGCPIRSFWLLKVWHSSTTCSLFLQNWHLLLVPSDQVSSVCVWRYGCVSMRSIAYSGVSGTLSSSGNSAL